MPRVVYKDSGTGMVIAANENQGAEGPIWSQAQCWSASEYVRHLKETEFRFCPEGAERRVAQLPEMPQGMMERVLN